MVGELQDSGHGAEWVDAGAWARLVHDDSYGWVVLDDQGVIRYFNEGIQLLLGWDPATALGSSVFDYVVLDDLDGALAAMAELVDANEEIVSVGIPMVFEVRRADGTTQPVEVGAGAYLDEDGPGFIRLRVRDFRPDAALHQYLEALASTTAEDAEILRAGMQLADMALMGGTTVLAHDWHDGNFRSWASVSVPPPVLAALEATDPGDLPWVTPELGRSVVVASDELPEPLASAAAAAGLHSCWAEPITLATGPEPVAVLLIFRPFQQPPLVGHRAAALRLRATLGLAFLAREARDRLVRAAESDSLTGLGNRAVAFDLLEVEIKNGPTGVLYVDLDGFKAVNDSRGHGAGDEVLVVVAEHLRQVTGTRATAARIGGDEFLVIVGGGPGVTELTALADEVVARLSVPIETAGGTVELSATVGIACTPEHGDTPDEVVEAADRALYRAKRSGGRSWAVAYTENP